MGVVVKRNRKKEYQLYSSISDEILHDKEWLTEDEAKTILIERKFSEFIQNAIKIDMEFPNNYSVNDIVKSHNSLEFLHWWEKSTFSYEKLYERATVLFKRLNLKYNFKE